MIVIPNSPPLPIHFESDDSDLPSSLVTDRLTLNGLVENGEIKDVVRYIINLENFVNDIFKYIKEEHGGLSLNDSISISNRLVVSKNKIPWTNFLVAKGSDIKSKTSNKSKASAEHSEKRWTLNNEIEAILISLSSSYNLLASNICNDLIKINCKNNMEEINEKWKKCSNHYKKSLGFLEFVGFLHKIEAGQTIRENHTINPILNEFWKKITLASLQLLMLVKSLWLQRENPISNTNNNSTLTRVSIFILDEIQSCQEITKNLDRSTNSLTLAMSNWEEYLKLIHNYITAYSGMFLSIEYYNKNQLGHAIGLVNFSLLNLQQKTTAERKHPNVSESSGSPSANLLSQSSPTATQTSTTSKRSKLINKLNFNAKVSTKIQSHKNESFISSLDATSTLKLSKSNYNIPIASSVVTDLNFLFDELIRLNLKYTKENDNLKFDKVENWSDVSRDSKWPSGLKVPITTDCWVPDLWKQSPTFEQANNDNTDGYY